MTVFHITAIVLSVTAVLALVNRRVLKWPEAIGVMALALILSLTMLAIGKFLPDELHAVCERIAAFDFSGFVLHVALSFLIFAGAFAIDASLLVRERVPVLIFATVGILLSTAVVGLLTHWMLGLIGVSGVPLIHCLLFGALISPTDPIAVLSILNKAGVDKDLSADIAGESLLNDGIGVVVFVTLLQLAGADSEHFGIGQVAGHLGLEVGGGVLFGAALGLLGRTAIRLAKNAQLDILISLALVVGGYALAELLHLSAPLAMVVAGLWLGFEIRSQRTEKEAREEVTIFWESLDSIFNAVLFVLLGIVFVGLSHTLEVEAILAGLLAIPIVLLARVLSLAITIPLTPLRRKCHPAKSLALLSWGGLRGAISVALALSLSADLHRNLFVQITYVVVVFSILAQGLSIGALAKRLKLSQAA